jgi:hypothetical protein
MPDLNSNHAMAGCDDRPHAESPTVRPVYAPPASRSDPPQHEHRLERLIDRLPSRFRTTVRWLRKPSSRWVRIPAGVLLIGGGLLGILPLLGFWMLPLGLILLAEDVPLLRTWRDRILTWIEQRRPHWLRGTTP